MKQSDGLWLAVLGLVVAGTSRGAAQLSEAAGIRAAVPFELGRFDLRVSGTVHRLDSPVGTRTPFTFESALRVPLRSSGFYLGGGVEGGAQVDSLPTRPFLSYGAWSSFSRIQVSVGAATHRLRLGGIAARGVLDTTGVSQVVRVDSGKPSQPAFWSDVEGRIAWRLSALSMDAVVGARARVQTFAPAVWGRLGATYPLSSRFALSAAAGAEPARIGLGLPASGFVSVALRVRPWRSSSSVELGPAAAFAVQPASEGSYRVTYAAPNASRVELSGDFDAWRPTSLTETQPGVWQATLALKPGTYHVNVRVDGGRWLPPPGLPQAEDDFSGAVGVLVVR